MSAYLVEKNHVRYLIAAAVRFEACIQVKNSAGNLEWRAAKEATDDELSEVGQDLWNENAASVEGRYPSLKGKTLPGEDENTPKDDRLFFTFDPSTFYEDLSPAQVIKAVHCYSYQSCEHEGWRTSRAREFCDHLAHIAESRIPGYDKAVWGAPEPSTGKRLLVGRKRG